MLYTELFFPLEDALFSLTEQPKLHYDGLIHNVGQIWSNSTKCLIVNHKANCWERYWVASCFLEMRLDFSKMMDLFNCSINMFNVVFSHVIEVRNILFINRVRSIVHLLIAHLFSWFITVLEVNTSYLPLYHSKMSQTKMI